MEPVDLTAHFISCVKREFEWHENFIPLPPGETTPYLDRVARFTMGMLATKLDNGYLTVFPRRSMSDWKGATWAFRIQDRWFTMDGETTLEDLLEKMKKERVALVGDELAETLSFATPDPGALLIPQNDQYAKDNLHKMQGLWATEIQAKILEAATPTLSRSKPGLRL